MDRNKITKRVSMSTPKFCGNSAKCFVFEDEQRAILVQEKYPFNLNEDTIEKLNKLNLNIPKIYSHFQGENGYYYLEESLVQGEPLFYRMRQRFCLSQGLKYDPQNHDEHLQAYKEHSIAQAQIYLSAPQIHFDKFVKTLVILEILNIGTEYRADNFTYSPKSGFGIVDLSLCSKIREDAFQMILNDQYTLQDLVQKFDPKGSSVERVKNRITTIFTAGSGDMGKMFIPEKIKQELVNKMITGYNNLNIRIIDSSLKTLS